MAKAKTGSGERSGRSAEIRDAAIDLFDERGYHGTRMEDIAARLGMRAPSLYNHLSSKQELLSEVVVEHLQVLLDEHAMAVASTTDVSEQLRRAMEAHVRHYARFGRESRIANREVQSLDEPDRTTVLDMRTELGLNWARLIERGVDEGRFDVNSPQLTAYALLKMSVGVAMWLRPPPVSESELVYTFGEIALRVVGADRPGAATPAAALAVPTAT
jgi:AcrR family transcriptional regulator